MSDRSLEQWSQRLVSDHEEPDLAPITGIDACTLPTSLSEAIREIIEVSGQPALVSLMENVELAMEFASTKETSTLTLYGLVLDEVAAIHLYTQDTELFRILNALLRAQDRAQIQPFLKYLKLLLNALYKLPVVKCKVYRGLRQSLQTLGWQKGNVIVWWGFSSATRTLSVLQEPEFFGVEGDRTFCMVSVMSGVDIKEFSALPDEDEVLLLPGTRLIVDSILPLSASGQGSMVDLVEQPGQPCLDFTRDMVSMDDDLTRLRQSIIRGASNLPRTSDEFEGLRLAACDHLLQNQEIVSLLVEGMRSKSKDLPEERLQECQVILDDWQTVIKQTVEITVGMSKKTEGKKKAVKALKSLHKELQAIEDPSDEESIEPQKLRSMTACRDLAIRKLQEVMGQTADTDELKELMNKYDDLMGKITNELSILEAEDKRLKEMEREKVKEIEGLEHDKADKVKEIEANKFYIKCWTVAAIAVAALGLVSLAMTYPSIASQASETWSSLTNYIKLRQKVSLSETVVAQASQDFQSARALAEQVGQSLKTAEQVSQDACKMAKDSQTLWNKWMDPKKIEELATQAKETAQAAQALLCENAESVGRYREAANALVGARAGLQQNQNMCDGALLSAGTNALKLAGGATGQLSFALSAWRLRQKLRDDLRDMEKHAQKMEDEMGKMRSTIHASEALATELSKQMEGMRALQSHHKALKDELGDCNLHAYKLEKSVEFLRSYLDTDGFELWVLLKEPETGEELENLNQRILEVESKIQDLHRVSLDSFQRVVLG